MNPLSSSLPSTTLQASQRQEHSPTDEEELIGSLLTRSMLQNIKLEDKAPLAARLLYHIKPEAIETPDIRTLETILRNKGLLNRLVDPDLTLIGTGKSSVKAHRSILALESEHFRNMREFVAFKNGVVTIPNFPTKIIRLMVKYLYSSNDKRKEYVSEVKKEQLPSLAELADYMGIEELGKACDEELCHSISELQIEDEDVKNWVKFSHSLPKFNRLIQFLYTAFATKSIQKTLKKMLTRKGVGQLAARCDPEEMKLFASLNTEFGKRCRIPDGAFGKKEWEEHFRMKIIYIPPLPENIDEILEMDDPWEPAKKLKETCLLFLKPKRVSFGTGFYSGDRHPLSIYGIIELAKRVIDPKRRIMEIGGVHIDFDNLKVKKSEWVLMRKELIPHSRRKSFQTQMKLLKGNFKVPTLFDAIIMNLISYVSNGTFLYGENPWTYTRCQEMHEDTPLSVGGMSQIEQIIICSNMDGLVTGLSAVWKF